MSKAPFEQIINDLLSQTAAADALRNIADGQRTSSMYSMVDSILLEQSLAAQFDPEGYADDSKRESVLDKLNLLKTKLVRNLVDCNDADFIVVKLCIDYISNGYSLTTDIINCLNKIDKKYV
jgi:hypothetical protein